ncbi:hypothetical protein [Pseudomonas sp. UMAB-40]|uniref:hypothetical protein n=1 Tax=Pseudomonas sp. UMAB-40 TaxID=1365407 RepID=UPI001C56A716|nr:hypothetical protein [Pseudomonas sp. UMAB-40]
MITEDLELVKKIFALIESGIVHDYDSFSYEVEVGEGYLEWQLKVEINGVSVTNAETNFNGAILHSLVDELNANAVKRGEKWVSFVMSYTHGGEVKTNFKY